MDPAGNGDGSSWLLPASNLCDAADSYLTSSLLFLNQIWMADGIQMLATTCVINVDGIRIYGGFTNGMTMADRDPKAYPSILDGGDVMRCLSIQASDVTLDGLTIQNGYVSSGVSGAGVMFGDGNIGVNSSISNLTMLNCTIQDCASQGQNPVPQGIGLSLFPDSGFVTMDNCRILDNRMNVHNSADGCGIYARQFDELTIVDCVVSNNGGGGGQSVFSGGGLYAHTVGLIVVSNTVFQHNNADSKYGDSNDGGGGVFLEGGSTGIDAWFEKCSFLDNYCLADQLGEGGGLMTRGATCLVTLQNCLFAGNGQGPESMGRGGAVLATSSSQIRLYHCTFADNVTDLAISNNAAGGGAMHAEGSATVQMWNCLFYGNSAAYGEDTLAARSGGTIALNTGWIEDLSVTNISAVDVTVTNALTGSDPLMVNPSAGDYSLQSASACVDAALLIAGIDCDRNGRVRPLDGDNNGSSISDIGCYEYLHSEADSDGDTLTDAFEEGLGTDPSRADTDGDGPDDWEEFTAGTDGTDKDSYFAIVAVSNNSPFSVWVQSYSNRTYTLHCTDSLTTGAWYEVSGQVDLAGDDDLLKLTDTNANSAEKFYEVEVKFPLQD